MLNFVTYVVLRFNPITVFVFLGKHLDAMLVMKQLLLYNYLNVYNIYNICN